MTQLLKNPILPGFYPDPSVCRKGEDYYLVTSTFEYFPGIPIFHSKDFVHWHQIGHVLTRPEQLNLDGIRPSRGIYASSIFYHEERNRFYVITTLVGNSPYWDNVNFYVWADNPAGPWSNPVVVSGAEGIDPSLVFDGDKTYYLGNLRPFPEEPAKGRHIWLQELNLDTGELTGERKILLRSGALVQAATPEGPHIYHIGDWYYLLIAEGGTFRNHAVTVFRSRKLEGPYENNPRNPIMTHRNLRRDYPVQNPGHADLIQLQNGEWWAVLLATRQVGEAYGNLGRETYGVPVIWEEEWPVFSADTGHVELSYPAPGLKETVFETEPEKDDFDRETPGFSWITLRTPKKKFFSFTDRPGYLRLFLQKHTVKDTSNCSFFGRRQQHMCFEFCTVMEFVPRQECETAGVVLMMNRDFHIKLEYGIFDGVQAVRAARCMAGQDERLGSVKWNRKATWMRAVMRYQELLFEISEDGVFWLSVGDYIDGSVLSRQTAGGYTGTVLGLYASGNGKESDRYADFDWAVYRPL